MLNTEVMNSGMAKCFVAILNKLQILNLSFICCLKLLTYEMDIYIYILNLLGGVDHVYKF